MTAAVFPIVRPPLSIGVYLHSPDLIRSLEQMLLGGESEDRYTLLMVESRNDFFRMIEHQKQQLDCLILQDSFDLSEIVQWLHKEATLLPVVIFQTDACGVDPGFEPLYHDAEVWMPLINLAQCDLSQIKLTIDRAIEAFLGLSPLCQLPNPVDPTDRTRDLITQNFLMLQQRRLTDKLKERLGYLGVYYKRSPKNFLRSLPPDEQAELLRQLRAEYRSIVLSYFSDDPDMNQQIDNFVNAAFFADVPVSYVVETHMELMDEFAKQLKLEGRSEEILLDYRLTLIDTIAHLCEMYRRSIPRES